MRDAKFHRKELDIMDKPRLTLPVVVEGKYDKVTLTALFDCTVLVADGFGLFNSKEKQALIRKVGANGIIVLTDSDGGGKVIRSFLSGILPRESVYHLYVPKIPGKEKRKTAPSKEGYLGVEGMSREVLMPLFEPFFATDTGVNAKKSGDPITKVDLFELRLTGYQGAAERRDTLAVFFGLPSGMTPNALVAALNVISGREELFEVARKLGL
jgi:ribonuclease M5